MTSSNPYVASQSGKTMPDEEFLVRTILHSNMTIIHNRVEDFKYQMEQKLTRAYRYGWHIIERPQSARRAPAECPQSARRAPVERPIGNWSINWLMPTLISDDSSVKNFIHR
jgi:hypothetical protein